MSLLGEPGKGFHATRFMGFALYDILGTLFIAGIVSYFAGWSFWWVLLGVFVLGEVLHWLFGVKTAFIRMLEASS